jgi:hypothetical protein
MLLRRRLTLTALLFTTPAVCPVYVHDPKIAALLLRISKTDGTVLERGKATGCAALLGFKMANDRDPAVVPELAELPAASPILQVSSNVFDTKSTPEGGVSAYRDARAACAASLVGPAISSVSLPLATLGTIDRLVMDSYSASSPLLSDGDLLYFHRTFPADTVPVKPLCVWMKVRQ